MYRPHLQSTIVNAELYGAFHIVTKLGRRTAMQNEARFGLQALHTLPPDCITGSSIKWLLCHWNPQASVTLLQTLPLDATKPGLTISSKITCSCISSSNTQITDACSFWSRDLCLSVFWHRQSLNYLVPFNFLRSKDNRSLWRTRGAAQLHLKHLQRRCCLMLNLIESRP